MLIREEQWPFAKGQSAYELWDSFGKETDGYWGPVVFQKDKKYSGCLGQCFSSFEIPGSFQALRNY